MTFHGLIHENHELNLMDKVRLKVEHLSMMRIIQARNA